MGETGGIQAGSQFIQGGAAMGGAITQASALRSQGAYSAQQGTMNATLARLNADDALKRGDFQASQQLLKTSQLTGSQRAAQGASGVDVNSGSAAQVQADTQHLGALDALTIKNNAWRQAWGYEVQATQYENQGQMEKLAAENKASNTLLTGGMQATAFGMKGYGAWLQSRKQGGSPAGTKMAGESYDDMREKA